MPIETPGRDLCKRTRNQTSSATQYGRKAEVLPEATGTISPLASPFTASLAGCVDPAVKGSRAASDLEYLLPIRHVGELRRASMSPVKLATPGVGCRITAGPRKTAVSGAFKAFYAGEIDRRACRRCVGLNSYRGRLIRRRPDTQV